jgi:hypothetical protein
MFAGQPMGSMARGKLGVHSPLMNTSAGRAAAARHDK